MVQHDKAGSDRHQPVAQTVQSHPPTPGPQHAPSCSRNSNQEWHRTWGIDRSLTLGNTTSLFVDRLFFCRWITTYPLIPDSRSCIGLQFWLFTGFFCLLLTDYHLVELGLEPLPSSRSLLWNLPMTDQEKTTAGIVRPRS